MIPTLEDIIRMLVAGDCSPSQALAWLTQHEALAAERRAEDRRMFEAMNMAALLGGDKPCGGDKARVAVRVAWANPDDYEAFASGEDHAFTVYRYGEPGFDVAIYAAPPATPEPKR